MLRRKKILQDQAYANTEKLVNINSISRLGGSHAASKLLTSGYKSQSQAALSSLRFSELDPYALGLSVDSIGSETQKDAPVPRIELDLPSPNKYTPGKSKFSKLPDKVSTSGSPKKQKSNQVTSEVDRFKHPLIDQDSEDSILPQHSPAKSLNPNKREAIPLNDAVLEMPSNNILASKGNRDFSESQNWNMTPNQLYSNQSICLDGDKAQGVQQQSRLLGKSFSPQAHKPEVGSSSSSSNMQVSGFMGSICPKLLESTCSPRLLSANISRKIRSCRETSCLRSKPRQSKIETDLDRETRRPVIAITRTGLKRSN